MKADITDLTSDTDTSDITIPSNSNAIRFNLISEENNKRSPTVQLEGKILCKI